MALEGTIENHGTLHLSSAHIAVISRVSTRSTTRDLTDVVAERPRRSSCTTRERSESSRAHGSSRASITSAASRAPRSCTAVAGRSSGLQFKRSVGRLSAVWNHRRRFSAWTGPARRSTGWITAVDHRRGSLELRGGAARQPAGRRTNTGVVTLGDGALLQPAWLVRADGWHDHARANGIHPIRCRSRERAGWDAVRDRHGRARRSPTGHSSSRTPRSLLHVAGSYTQSPAGTLAIPADAPAARGNWR